MKLEHYDTVNFPQWALSRAINGSPIESGTEEQNAEDEKQVDEYLEQLPTGFILEYGDCHPYFSNNPEFGLSCDCVEVKIWVPK